MISAPNLSLNWGICVCITKMRSLWSNMSGHLDLPTNLRKWKASYWLQQALAATGCSCVVVIQNIPLGLRWWHLRLWAALEGINLHTGYNKTRSAWHSQMTVPSLAGPQWRWPMALQGEAHLFSLDGPAQQGPSLLLVWKRGVVLEDFLLGEVGISWDNRRAELSLK